MQYTREDKLLTDMKQKAVIYARCKAEEQQTPENNLLLQVAACKQYAKDKNLNVLKVFKEFSFYPFLMRKGANEMIDFSKVHIHDIGFIIMLHPTNISRSPFDTMKIIEAFKKDGIEVLYAYEDPSIKLLHKITK